LDNLPKLESRAKAIIDKIKNGEIKLWKKYKNF
jgi:hypothetical protein